RSKKFPGTYCRFGGSVMHSNQKTTFQIVMFELLCNPLWAQHFRNIWKKMLKEKLWECVFDDNNLELSNQCETEFDGEGQQRRYQDLDLYDYTNENFYESRVQVYILQSPDLLENMRL
ncbi:unnamed protein product, partial [Allacma fusca]